MAQRSHAAALLRNLAWPLLLGLCLYATPHALASEWPVLAFNAIYLSLAATLLWLERRLPHEPRWNQGDGQLFADLGHTLTSKGAVQALVVFAGLSGLDTWLRRSGGEAAGLGLWPLHWPLYLQVALAVLVAEFGLYWAHRLAHTWPRLWRFHAVHHSVERLWVVNTGRFHFVDTLVSIGLGIVPLLLLGAPIAVLLWLSALTAYVGLLTHCNVAMENRLCSWLFNTPNTHRWHHSRQLNEGNRNFGENLLLWDHLFGTYYHSTRRPPADIGIAEAMPARFIEQLAWPFRSDDPRSQAGGTTRQPQQSR